VRLHNGYCLTYLNRHTLRRCDHVNKRHRENSHQDGSLYSHGVYHFFSGLQTCAKTDKFATIKILHGLNMFQDLQGEKEAVDWLMTIIVKA